MAFQISIPVLTLLATLVTSGLDAPAIHAAVSRGDLAEVRRILDGDPGQLEAADESGRTPLYVAARAGHTGVTALLLERGASVATRTASGFTPLFAALQGRHREVAAAILARGADVNAVSKYETTPLFVAAEADEADLVGLLLDRGANPNHVSPVFGTALHRAAYMDAPEAAARLLSGGADVTLRDRRGLTALGQAAMLGSVAVARLCLERGADANAADAGGITPLMTAILWGTTRPKGVNRSTELAALLLAHGASASVAAADGATPLAAAVDRGYAGIVSMLLHHGGPVAQTEPGTARTLLHLAALRGFGDLVDLLLAHGADPTAVDARGRIALDYAREHGHETALVRLAPITPDDRTGHADRRRTLGPLPDGEAAIWLLKTRGWAVQTAGRLFVFDHEERGRRPDLPSLANGWIRAAEIAPLDVLALYSAFHAAPGTMEFIHALEPVLPRVAYLNYQGDPWRGGQKTSYLTGREVRQLGDVTVVPYETRDAMGMGSLGYLVRSPGLVLFYPNFFPEDLAALKAEIDELARHTDRCDIAFVETTPGQPNAHAAHVVERLKPRVVVPFDRGGDLAAAERLATELRRSFPGPQVVVARDPGDRLHYVGGAVTAASLPPVRVGSK